MSHCTSFHLWTANVSAAVFALQYEERHSSHFQQLTQDLRKELILIMLFVSTSGSSSTGLVEVLIVDRGPAWVRSPCRSSPVFYTWTAFTSEPMAPWVEKRAVYAISCCFLRNSLQGPKLLRVAICAYGRGWDWSSTWQKKKVCKI